MSKFSKTTVYFLVLLLVTVAIGVMLIQRIKTLEVTVRVLSDAILQLKAGSQLNVR